MSTERIEPRVRFTVDEDTKRALDLHIRIKTHAALVKEQLKRIREERATGMIRISHTSVYKSKEPRVISSAAEPFADAYEPEEQKFSIPEPAERLLYYIAPRELRAAITGDLEEEAQRLAVKWGYSSARRWYWFQVVRVAYEQVKLFLTISVVLGAWRAIRGLFSGG